MTTAKRSISLRPDQVAWLAAHPEVNLSGYIQRWLDGLIDAIDGR